MVETSSKPRLEVLGAPIVRWGNVEMALSPRKPNQVVLLLVASAGHASSSARLLDQIWSRNPDRSGMDSLKNAVYQANQRVEDGVGVRPIVSRGGDGYAIDLDVIEVDADHFESIVDRLVATHDLADIADLHRLATAACEMWRGEEPMVGFHNLPAVGEYARRLELLHLSARKQLYESALALGRHDEVLIDVTRLAGLHPFDEAIHSTLMLTLARSGRQRDAMEVYDSLRRRLIETTGVEPSQHVQDLQMRILTQHESTNWRPRRQTVQPGPGVTGHRGRLLHPDIGGLTRHPLAGRTSEIEELTADNDQVTRWVVSAPPGMGKSRLVAEVVERMAASGRSVLFGRCRADRRAALDPIDDMIGGLSPLPLTDRDEAPTGPASPFSFMPEADPATRLDRRVEAAVRQLAEAAVNSPLVVIEDAQWVDQATLDVVDRLDQRLGPNQLDLILTCRPSALERGQDNDHLVDWLGTTDWKRLDLRPLSDEAIAELVAQVLPERHLNRLDAVKELVRRSTTGIPLLVKEVLATVEYEAIKRRPFSLAHIEAVAPKTLTAAVHRRLLRLSDEAREVIKAAAVGGSKFDLDVLARVVGRSDDETATMLDICVAESLITESGRSLGTYEFAHELLRSAVLTEVGTNQRARLHRRFAASLDVLRGPMADFDRARHLLGALPLGEADVAIEASLRAAGRSADHFDVDEAIGLLHRALRAVDGMSVSDGAICDLLIALATVQSWGGEPAAAEATLATALETARRADDPARFAKAVLAPGPNHRVVFSTGDRLELLVESRDRLALDRPSAIGVSIEANLLGESLLPGRPTDFSVVPAELLRRAREVGDPRALIDTLFACHSAAKTDPDAAARTRLSEQIVEIGESSPIFLNQLCGGLGCRLYDLGAEGRFEAAERSADRLEQLADQLSLPRYRWRSMVVRSALLRLAERFEEADRLSGEALIVGRGFDSADAEVVFGMQMRETMRHTVSSAALIGPMRNAAATNKNPIVVQLLLVDALVADDNRFEAERIWSRLSNDLAVLPRQELWLPTMALAAELSATAIDDRPAAEMVLAALTPFSGQWVPVGVPLANWGPVDGYIGALSARLERASDADHFFDRAIGQVERSGASIWRRWIDDLRNQLGTEENYRPFTDDN